MDANRLGRIYVGIVKYCGWMIGLFGMIGSLQAHPLDFKEIISQHFDLRNQLGAAGVSRLGQSGFRSGQSDTGVAQESSGVISIPTLREQRCWNHELREAAVCCPACKRCFCRECVTEHDDRLLCAECLRRIAQSGSAERSKAAKLKGIFLASLGVFLAWFFFYLVGQTLIQIPAEVHEGTAWRVQ